MVFGDSFYASPRLAAPKHGPPLTPLGSPLGCLLRRLAVLGEMGLLFKSFISLLCSTSKARLSLPSEEGPGKEASRRVQGEGRRGGQEHGGQSNCKKNHITQATAGRAEGAGTEGGTPTPPQREARGSLGRGVTRWRPRGRALDGGLCLSTGLKRGLSRGSTKDGLQSPGLGPGGGD